MRCEDVKAELEQQVFSAAFEDIDSSYNYALFYSFHFQDEQEVEPEDHTL